MIPVCKSTLHRPRARRPLANRVEEEAVLDDVRVVRLLVDHERLTSVLHQVQSRRLGRRRMATAAAAPARAPAASRDGARACVCATPGAAAAARAPAASRDGARARVCATPRAAAAAHVVCFSRFKPQRPVEGHIALRGYAAWTAEGGPPRRGEAAVIPRAEASTR